MIRKIIGASCLAPFRPGHDWRPALDELASLGYDCTRTFCGPLPWAGQERAHVYQRLPQFLQDCADRGLNAYLSYCTEAGTGYDLREHVSEVERIAREFPAVVLREVANEPTHPTQGGRLSPEACRDLAEAMGDVCAGLGAAEDDESTSYAFGDFTPMHLSRARDKWNQVRRVREGLALSESTGTPVLNQEPIGADEQRVAGKRENDPAFFYCLGALNRLFLGGSGVFHSQSGLMAERLGPNQLACAGAYLAGATVWPGAHRLTYKNVGHDGSPITAARFNEGDMGTEGCTRSYSGLDGDRGINVTLGLVGDAGLSWGNGWRPGAVLGQMPGVLVREVER
jgi:hypothetical protein